MRIRLAAAAIFALGLGAMPALAQNNDIQIILDQMRLIQGDLLDLQRQVYGDQIPARPEGAPAVAAVPAVADNRQAALAAQFEVRLAALEGEIRSLTGDIERVGHDAAQNRDRLERLVEDVDFRLISIEAQLANLVAALAGGGAPIVPAAGNVPGGAPVAGAVVPGGPVQVEAGGDPGAAGAQVLGALPADGNENLGIQIQPDVLDVLPEGTPEEQYAFAYGLLQQFRIPEAEQAFAEFVLVNPGHALTGNAQYWLGETYYARSMFQEAALTFFQGYQEDSTGEKAADNLLKLGMSLARMEQTTEACATFGELAVQFPDATQTVMDQAASERTRLSCP
ncbi:MAG: tol-pal system protein YbgF [Alphaproteobacteria bacterium]|nr:tol-pal system protein YbgF [Alphaproteobacteria bacterium]MBT5860289.1 tol-pal system protein YbgF [Alphaproteobacteria bacterium]